MSAETDPTITPDTPAPAADAPPAEAPKVAPVKAASPPPPSRQEQPAPPREPSPKGDAPDAVSLALRSLQADNATLEGSLRKVEKRASEAEKERDALRAQVETFTRRDREGAIVGEIRKAAPHRTDLEVRGILAALAEQGAVDRYSEKAAEEAAKALEVLKSSAPEWLKAPQRQPVGGPAGVPLQNPGRVYKSPM